MKTAKISLPGIQNKRVAKITLKYPKDMDKDSLFYLKKDLKDFQELKQPKENLFFKVVKKDDGDFFVSLREAKLFKPKKARYTSLVGSEEVKDHGAWEFLDAFLDLYNDLKVFSLKLY